MRLSEWQASHRLDAATATSPVTSPLLSDTRGSPPLPLPTAQRVSATRSSQELLYLLLGGATLQRQRQPLSAAWIEAMRQRTYTIPSSSTSSSEPPREQTQLVPLLVPATPAAAAVLLAIALADGPLVSETTS